MRHWRIEYPNGIAGYIQADSEQDAFEAAQWRWGRMPESVQQVPFSEAAANA